MLSNHCGTVLLQTGESQKRWWLKTKNSKLNKCYPNSTQNNEFLPLSTLNKEERQKFLKSTANLAEIIGKPNNNESKMNSENDTIDEIAEK